MLQLSDSEFGVNRGIGPLQSAGNTMQPLTIEPVAEAQMADGTNTPIWREITGFPKYEVSDTGSVRNAQTGRILSFGKARGGYLIIPLMSERSRITKYVARLVAIEFVTQTPGKNEVNHIDGDKENNRASNLEWVTPSENVRHKINVLGKGRGESAPNAKLTDEIVALIRADACSNRDMAKKLGCHESTISNVRRGHSWGHLGEGPSCYDRRTRLSREAVAQIRADTRLQREIAADYGISACYVSEIKSGRKRRSQS